MEVTFTTMQSAGRSGALNTRRHAFGGPGDWSGGEREAEVEFEFASGGGAVSPGAGTGRTECSFPLSFPFVSFLAVVGGKETGKPYYDSMQSGTGYGYL